MAQSSDSENFESADEDFISDDETKTDQLSVVATAKLASKTEIKLEDTPKVQIPSEQASSNTVLEHAIKAVNTDERFTDVYNENDADAISKKLSEIKTDPKILEPAKVRNIVQAITKQEDTESEPVIATKETENSSIVIAKGDTLSGDQLSTKKESVKDEISTANIVEFTNIKKAEEVLKKKSQAIPIIPSSEEPVPNVSSIPIAETVTHHKKDNIIEPKLPESDPDADDEGWEFDEWGDEEQATVSGSTTKPVVEEQDVGWDVWDDEDDVEIPNAGTQSSVQAANKSSGSDQFFPVLADISPKKEAKTEGGLLGNISKFLISDENPSTFPLQNRKESIDGIPAASNASNWGWKPWGGVASLLSTATEGMATITSNVSSLIESGIGAPDPMELARHQREVQLKREAAAAAAANESLNRVPSDGRLSDAEISTDTVNSDSDQQEKKSDEKSLYLGSFVSGVTQIGNRVIAGGLDTLEGIGKKTMTILQENDPGLLNKRKLLMMDKDAPALSQILREAKEKTEEAEKNLKIMHKQQYKKQLHFETLFDDYHGLVHLEALEMLSRQSSIKLQSLVAPLSGRALDELQETLDEVKELCELPELDADDSDGTHTAEELSEKLCTAIEDLDVQMDFTEMLQCWRDSRDWLQSDTSSDPQVIHDRALRCLAQTTAFAVHRLHKLAELLLIKDRHSTADEADSLVQLTNTVCWHLSGIAARFGGALSQLKNEDEANSLITSTFMEGSNSILYIQNAFQLFIPILQVGAA